MQGSLAYVEAGCPVRRCLTSHDNEQGGPLPPHFMLPGLSSISAPLSLEWPDHLEHYPFGLSSLAGSPKLQDSRPGPCAKLLGT